ILFITSVRASSNLLPDTFLLLLASCEMVPQAAAYSFSPDLEPPATGRVETMSVRLNLAAIVELASSIAAFVSFAPALFAFLQASSVTGVTATVLDPVVTPETTARSGFCRVTVVVGSTSSVNDPDTSTTTGPL